MKRTLIIFIFILLTTQLSNSQNNINNMENFEKISWEELNYNFLKLIGTDWMLITAGSSLSDFNMMTAGWGTIGWLWGKPVTNIYIRPQRHTHNFTENNDTYTITFFDDSHKKILRNMGSVSGKDFDKINNSGLTPIETENKSVAFKEAYLVIECRKLYSSVLEENNFIDKNIIAKAYPNKDYHTVYTGEILNIWIRKNK